MTAATVNQTQVQNIVRFIEQHKSIGHLMKRLKSHHETTYWHSIRVAYFTLLLARSYPMSVKEQEILFCSTLLHDIGKLTIPVEVLDKTDKLTEEEWTIIQSHPTTGAELLEYIVRDEAIDFDVILYHHENIDGSGYPGGRGEMNLPLSVRIVRVVDSFDAMTSERAYKKQTSVADAVKELYRYGGQSFDLNVVQRFENLLTSHLDVFETMRTLCANWDGRL